MRRDNPDVQVPLHHERELVPVPQPFHLKHSPQAHPTCFEGKWMAQYSVDRTMCNNRYSNVRDVWVLPKRNYLARLFIGSIEGRVTANGLLAIPVNKTSRMRLRAML